MNTAIVRLSIVVLTTLLLATYGCGSWERKVIFPGAISGDALEIKQPFPINEAGIQVNLKRKNVIKQLYELRGDVFLEFADAAWSADDNVVGLFVSGTPVQRFAYKTSDGTAIPFGVVARAVAAHIRSQYHLDPKLSDKDVFEWAGSLEGRDAFRKLYPGARAR